MKTVAVIQARLGSERLPRKVITDICGHTLLSLSVARLKKVKGLGSIWIATGPRDMNREIEAALPAGVLMHYGSEEDVLSRFISVINEERCDYVFRVNGDNPFPDFTRMERFMEIAAKTPCDYITVEGLPLGLRTELVRAESLRTLSMSADTRQREHITVAFRDNINAYHVISERESLVGADSVRLTVDEEADLQMLRALLARYPDAIDMEVSRIVRLMAASPDLLCINKRVAQRAV